MSMTATPEGRFRIAELARLTGFSTSALRYYESAGVLPAPQRAASGYRLYGARDVERLRLVARAKELGCTLEEIAGLVEAWDSDACEPVKHRLRSLVGSKVAEVRRRISEQVAFAAELEATAAALADRPADGPCDEHCGCTMRASSGGVRDGERVTFLARDEHVDTTPIACSLTSDDMHERVDEWHALLAHVVRREPIDGGVRLVLSAQAPLDEVARTVAAEHDCCRFFAFALTVDARGVALEVRAPAAGQDLLETVFGTAA